MKPYREKSELTMPFARIMSILMILCIVHLQAYSQKRKEGPPPLRERVFFGGSFGLQLGTYTNIEINPVAGLWVLPNLALAAGPGYKYYSDRNMRISTDIYGARAYAELVLVRDIGRMITILPNLGIITHAEIESLSLEREYWQGIPGENKRFWVSSFLAGGGISQPVGRKGAVTILALWVLTDSEYQLYSNPEIRISFTF